MFQQASAASAPAMGAPSMAPAVRPSGTVDLSRGVVYDVLTIPTSFGVTIQSNAGVGAATKTVYAFNTGVLNAAVTDNGSGAGSITTTYNDGFSGRVYDRLTGVCNGGRGVGIQGIISQVTNYTSGAQTATAYNTLQLQLLSANGEGGTTPVPMNPQEALRNTSNQVGILSFTKAFYFNGVEQLSFSLPSNTIIALTLITEKGSLV